MIWNYIIKPLQIPLHKLKHNIQEALQLSFKIWHPFRHKSNNVFIRQGNMMLSA